MKNKRLRKGLIIVLLFVTVSLALIILPSKLVSRLDSSLSLTSRLNYEIEMIAHRGFSSLYPENTLPAFEAAAREGFDGFELDVHTTKDGQWVVIHNETVDKMTDGEGAVRDMTLEELSRLTVDAGNGIKEHPGLKIPTLEQSLQVCKDKDIVPVIEIKGCDTELLPELKSMLDASGLSAKAVIISFNQEWLRLYRDLDSQIRMQLLTHNVTDETVALCEEYNFGISFNYKNLYKCLGALGDAREKGIELCAWTVDNTIYMDIMVLFGVRSITTNKIV